MKGMAVLGALMAFLMFTGFDCINDPIAVAVAVDPITKGFRINPGGTTYTSTQSVQLPDYVDEDYQESLIGGAIWDVGVRVNQLANNRNVTGTITVDGRLLARFTGQSWNSFISEKTVAKDPTLLQADSAGINHLIRLLSTKPLSYDPVVFVVSGSATTSIAPGDSVFVTVYAQAMANP